jgi:hypothetical protein
MKEQETISIDKFQEQIDRKVTVRVVSSRGHDEWQDVPEIALSRIQNEVANSKKWLYIDGVQQNANNLTVEKLLDAEYIILTNALVGG